MFGKTFRTYSKFLQIGVAKLVHGLQNTGEQRVRFKQDSSGLCPGCKSILETSAHVFQCTAEVMSNFREQELQTLGEFLDEQEFPSQLKQCLYHGIVEWTRGAMDTPQFIAPARGKVTVADQL